MAIKMTTTGSHLLELQAYLDTAYPGATLMPTRSTGKLPLHPHKNGQYTSENFMTTGYRECASGCMIILTQDLIVVDIDDHTYCETFENADPTFAQTVCCKTSKGKHYYFNSTPKSIAAKMMDGARQMFMDTGEAFPIDIKTITSTGTGGVISIPPSPNKIWERALGKHTVLPLSDRFVEFFQHHGSQNHHGPHDRVTPASETSHTSHASVLTDSANLDYTYIRSLVKILKESRADDYPTWIQLGWCLHNINPGVLYLDLWKEFSRLSHKYQEGECDRLWLQMRNDGLNIGTLCMWAKQDDAVNYDKVTQTATHALLDKSLSGTHTDIAKLIHRLYSEEFACGSIKDKLWFQFTGHRWVSVEKGYTLRQQISGRVSELYQERAATYMTMSMRDVETRRYKEKADKLLKQFNKLKMVSVKDSVLTEMSEFFYNPTFLKRLDDAPNLLCFTNGVYDLDALTFRDGKPDDYLTKCTGYAYDPAGNAEVQEDILDFLRSIMPTVEMVQYLLKTLAYMLHGNKYLEQFWFWTGRGRNGKGTLCTLLSKTLGEDYYYEPDITIVTSIKKSSSNANPELAKAKGKRLMVATEPDDADRDTKFRVNRLKQLRGNDLIQARGLYKDCEEYRPQFGMIFQMNDIPELSKVDDAIAKSLKIVEFPYQFVEHPQYEYQRSLDASLKVKFDRDARYHQQFMLLLLQTYRDAVCGKQMLSEPSEVANATSQYITENNPVSRWLSEHYQVTNNQEDRVSVEEMHRKFVEDSADHMGVSKKKFGSYMVLLGFKSRIGTDSRYYPGLKEKELIVEE